ncbi:MAG: 50S ribosomal protein L31e [Candidatus Aramenus sulfurataquae]|jgi:large subunit ribosomal protein L31e|uniref:Large ribosomal subunit protein eL31 n=2 Tax=Candidatus Aramenus sulfurataquae TaxID=1326980 RepID=W7L7U4_9CREN|nr:MAG: 50S ribosomal protein L31e [Candidatus Aramenus sulfurataquae]MBW9140984.1 50S ribosomal protein L31e [Candidatus Aramenus sp.]MCI2414549.1 50S ribosomal protein L31e [Candidatus Aramenus sp.]MCL7343510.1 50S ribosomal protein L31e [Candidatus Aramenus sulfurataquae]
MKEKDNFEMVINLRKVIMGKRTNRARRALRIIRETVARHFGAEKVILDPVLASIIARNKEKVDSRVRVVVTKVGEKTFLVKYAVKEK